MDLIYREQAVEGIENWIENDIYYHPYAKHNSIPVKEVMEIINSTPSAEHALAKCVDTLNAITQIISIAPSTIQEDVFRYKMICDVMRKYEGKKNGYDI